MDDTERTTRLPRGDTPPPRRPVTEAERRAIIDAMPKVKLRSGETSVSLARAARGGEP